MQKLSPLKRSEILPSVQPVRQLVIKQVTESALPGVVDTHHPYQGRGDPLSESDFLTMQTNTRTRGCTFSKSLIGEQYKLLQVSPLQPFSG